MLTTIQSDLNSISEFNPSFWMELKNKSLFGTGCTGFIGAWFIYSFIHLNKKHQLNATFTILTRNRNKLLEKYPELETEKSISIVEGDITDFKFPDGKFDYVIHGATEVASFQAGDASSLIDVSYLGTKRLIEFCKTRKVERVLFLSSGAAYGDLPQGLDKFSEDFKTGPVTNSAKSSYGEGKRLGEMLLFNEKAFSTVAARIFATCGAFLPMDSEYAFASFLKDCLKGQKIEIKGNGKSTRSYLYARDLILQLWTLLLKGTENEIYNVGSEIEVSIAELAQEFAKTLNPKVEVKVLGTDSAYSRYVPLTNKIKKQFDFPSEVPLQEAILKTAEFYKGKI